MGKCVTHTGQMLAAGSVGLRKRLPTKNPSVLCLMWQAAPCSSEAVSPESSYSSTLSCARSCFRRAVEPPEAVKSTYQSSSCDDLQLILFNYAQGC